MNDPIEAMWDAMQGWDLCKQSPHDMLRAALRAAEKAGWALVPREPQMAQIGDTQHKYRTETLHVRPPPNAQATGDLYRLMVEAGRLRLDESVKAGNAESVKTS